MASMCVFTLWLELQAETKYVLFTNLLLHFVLTVSYLIKLSLIKRIIDNMRTCALWLVDYEISKA
jgi:hypothetical protein